MLDPNRSYTADDLVAMQARTRSTQAGADLALKDVTHIYYNGPRAHEHVLRSSDNLRKLRQLNNVDVPIVVEATSLIPRGGMVYFSGDRLFACGFEPADAPASPPTNRNDLVVKGMGSLLALYVRIKSEEARRLSTDGYVLLEQLHANDLLTIVNALAAGAPADAIASASSVVGKDGRRPILDYLHSKLDEALEVSDDGYVLLEHLHADDLQAVVDALEKPAPAPVAP